MPAEHFTYLCSPTQLRQEMAAINPSAANQPGTPTTPTASTSGASTSAGDGISSPDTKDSITIKEEPHDPALMSPGVKKEEGEGGVKKEEEEDGEGKMRSSGDSELVKELRMQLK